MKMIIESIIGGMLILTPIEKGPDYNAQIQDVAQAKCLADNMYFEARNQGTAGIIAVSNVVLNRVVSDKFPDTICGLARQGQTENHGVLDKQKIPMMQCFTLSDTNASFLGIVMVKKINLATWNITMKCISLH